MFFEIRALATNILKDEEAAHHLMKVVRDAVNKRTKDFVGDEVNIRDLLDDPPQENVTKVSPSIAEAPPQGKHFPFALRARMPRS